MGSSPYPFPSPNLSSSGSSSVGKWSFPLWQLVLSQGLQLVEGLHLPLSRRWQGRQPGQLVLGAFLPQPCTAGGLGQLGLDQGHSAPLSVMTQLQTHTPRILPASVQGSETTLSRKITLGPLEKRNNLVGHLSTDLQYKSGLL